MSKESFCNFIDKVISLEDNESADANTCKTLRKLYAIARYWKRFNVFAEKQVISSILNQDGEDALSATVSSSTSQAEKQFINKLISRMEQARKEIDKLANGDIPNLIQIICKLFNALAERIEKFVRDQSD